jgi:NAD(P)-dependent dehydrogenase (short-subunit alcohol dehydrogenase family)
MMAQKLGHVILVSSLAGSRVIPNLSGYAAPKNTQIRLAQRLAEEGRPHGVHAFSIHPGDVLTELSDLAMADQDAEKYMPDFIGRLSRRKQTGDIDAAGLTKCAELCVSIAQGDFNGLSGSYLLPDGTQGAVS